MLITESQNFLDTGFTLLTYHQCMTAELNSEKHPPNVGCPIPGHTVMSVTDSSKVMGREPRALGERREQNTCHITNLLPPKGSLGSFADKTCTKLSLPQWLQGNEFIGFTLVHHSASHRTRLILAERRQVKYSSQNQNPVIHKCTPQNASPTVPLGRENPFSSHLV